jgi:hypothetical protein
MANELWASTDNDRPSKTSGIASRPNFLFFPLCFRIADQGRPEEQCSLTRLDVRLH